MAAAQKAAAQKPDKLTETDRRLTGFIRDSTWEALPAGVQERARICLMDNLAAALAGTQARSSAIAADFARAALPGEQATLICGGARASTLGAAFANGVAANAIDLDDSGMYTWGHPGAQILAAALALAEQSHASGAQMLAATVVGYEVMFRAGRCWYHRDPLLRGCGSWGSLGCAALAANLLALPAEQTWHALGIAEYHSPSLPLLRDLDEPAMVKHGIGLGAFNGIMAAQLAGRGFTGIASLLSFPEYQEWVGDIGRDYILPRGISWKDFACCAWAHPALVGLQRLRAQKALPGGVQAAAEIARIHVEVYAEAAHLGTRLPETTEEAQFNLAWPLAALLIDGEVGPQQVLEPRLKDEAIRTLAAKVTLSVSPELTRLYGLAENDDPEGRDAQQVTVELRDGRVIASGLVSIPPYREQNWDRERMEIKFRWLARPLASAAAVDRLVELVWGCDRLDDAGELAGAIAALRLGPAGQAVGA